MHLGEATMRLAISVERAEGDALVAAYKPTYRMARRLFARQDNQPCTDYSAKLANGGRSE